MINFKQRILLLVLIYAFTSASSQAQSQYNSSQEKLKLAKIETIILQENLQLLGKVNDFIVTQTGNFFLINSQTAAIIKYDKNGVQKKIMGRKGRGPFEFLNPSNLSINNDTLLIWDKSLLKLTAMSTTGENLLQLSDFSNAVSAINKYNNYIIAYNTGGSFGPLITIYDLSKKKISKEVGNKTNEHVLLMTLEGSGALTLVDDTVLYSLADQLILNSINLSNFYTDSLNISIPSFEVENLEKPPVQIVNNNRERLFEYLYNNSRVNNIFTLDDYIVVEAETGPIKIEGQNQFSERKTNFAVLNKDLNQIDTITFSNKNFVSTNLKAANENNLYIIYQKMSDGKLQYVLDIWEIRPFNK